MNYSKRNKLKQFIDRLSAKDREDFYHELLDSAYTARETQSLRPLVKTLEAWEESAEIFLDSETMNRIHRAEEGIKRGEGVLWNPEDFV